MTKSLFQFAIGLNFYNLTWKKKNFIVTMTLTLKYTIKWNWLKHWKNDLESYLEDCGIARNSEAGTSVRVDVFLEAEKQKKKFLVVFAYL